MTDGITKDAHYGSVDLVAKVKGALDQVGFGEGPIPWDALAPLDQFHVGGAAATTALAARLGIAPEATLLDVGCGLGGPARHIASVYGCTVQGIDLNAPFVDVARLLTQRTGLSDRVNHRVGDATQLPFEPASFDLALTQHVTMNIADRRTLYEGIFAVLRPGGRFAMFDVIAGDGQPPHFPVPWAREPTDSFLLSEGATRDVLEASGFVVLDWVDATEVGLKWLEAQAAAAQGRPERLRPLALPLIMGADFPLMATTLGRNFREGRTRLLQGIVQRPL